MVSVDEVCGRLGRQSGMPSQPSCSRFRSSPLFSCRPAAWDGTTSGGRLRDGSRHGSFLVMATATSAVR